MEDNKEYLFSTDKIISFINNLRDEYKVQKKDLSLARKNYFLKLDILDKKIIYKNYSWYRFFSIAGLPAKRTPGGT